MLAWLATVVLLQTPATPPQVDRDDVRAADELAPAGPVPKPHDPDDVRAVDDEPQSDVTALPRVRSDHDDVRSFDEAKPPAPINGVYDWPDDGQRLRRFFGAFAGAAGGIAGAWLLGLASNSSCTSFCGGTFGELLLVGGGPAIGAIAAWALHSAFGGPAGLGAALVGAIPGMLLTAMILGITAEKPGGVWTAASAAPSLIAGSLLTAGLITLALELRSRQLEEWARQGVDGAASGGRAFLEMGLTGLLLGFGLFATAALAYASATASIATAILTLGAAPFVTFALHRAVDGKGTIASALLGYFVGVGATIGLSLLIGLAVGSGGGGNTRFRDQSLALVIAAAGLAGTIGCGVGLELSHGSEMNENKVSLGLAPLRDGGMVMAGVRF